MPETPTQAGIVNMAAAMLGSSSRVTSIEDNGNLARHARAFWHLALREALADHPWNFALARAVLNEAGSKPPFGFDRAFALPADCLRWLPPGPDEHIYFEAVQEGDLLLTNSDAPLPVRYISLTKGEPIATWPAHFATAMAAKLAQHLAEPISQSETVDSKSWDKAEAAFRRAKRIDALSSGQKNRASVSARSRWLQASRRSFDPYR